MWRLVPLTFLFLALVFYQMSGGADYQPAPNSIQVRARLADPRPQARPLAPRITENVLTLSDSARDGTQDGADQQAPRDTPAAAPEPVRKHRVAVEVARAAPKAAPEQAAPRPTVPQTGQTGTPQPSERDLRRITGNDVTLFSGPGLRFDRQGTLADGTRVRVVKATPDGWLRVRVPATGQDGWVAEWLTTAAAQP